MKDLAGLMKQAQEMQKKMKEAQERLDDLEVVGESGAGMVKVRMSAKGDPRGVEIDPGVIDPDDKEVLEDLITAAMADAKRKADEASQKMLSEGMQGMGLPPGIDLPFGIKP